VPASDHLICICPGTCGLSPSPALLSGFDRLSDPDRRSPTSCFSASDRVSVPDRRSFEVRLPWPDRFSSLPIVVSMGLPRIMLDRAGLSHESRPPGKAWQSLATAPSPEADRSSGAIVRQTNYITDGRTRASPFGMIVTIHRGAPPDRSSLTDRTSPKNVDPHKFSAAGRPLY
jgi:hypothetical protein